MAKAKKKRAKKKASPMMGHNSVVLEEKERDAELLRIAKAQRLLDKKKSDARADFKTAQDALTGRLKEIGISRQAFKQPYDNFLRLANAENDDDAAQAQADNKLYLAQQRIAYNALSAGQTIDWIDLIQDADAIRKLREDEERKTAEKAAESADEPEETPAEL